MGVGGGGQGRSLDAPHCAGAHASAATDHCCRFSPHPGCPGSPWHLHSQWGNSWRAPPCLPQMVTNGKGQDATVSGHHTPANAAGTVAASPSLTCDPETPPFKALPSSYPVGRGTWEGGSCVDCRGVPEVPCSPTDISRGNSFAGHSGVKAESDLGPFPGVWAVLSDSLFMNKMWQN